MLNGASGVIQPQRRRAGKTKPPAGEVRGRGRSGGTGRPVLLVLVLALDRGDRGELPRLEVVQQRADVLTRQDPRLDPPGPGDADAEHVPVEVHDRPAALLRLD